MRVLLINPYPQAIVPNFGLEMVHQAIRQDHPVRLLDLAFTPAARIHRQVRQEIAQARPEVVGLSCNTTSLPLALDIAGTVRAAAPEARVVLGGVHPTLCAAEMMQHRRVDAVCVGEAERSFPRLLRAMAGGAGEAVEGTLYRGPKGRLVDGGRGAFIGDLDSLPEPTWEAWDMARYLAVSPYMAGMMPVTGGRGCPYNCTFCSLPALRHSMEGRCFRQRSPEAIVAEMTGLARRLGPAGLRGFLLFDETMIDGPHFLAFCRCYREQGLHRTHPWIFQATADNLTPRVVQAARRAGCMAVSFGVESGDERLRREVYGKTTLTDAVLLEATETLRRADMPYRTHFLMGCAGETPATLEATLEAMDRLGAMTYGVSVLQPLPSTGMAAATGPEEEARIRREGLARWGSFSIPTPGLTGAERRLFLLRFKARALAALLGWGLHRWPTAFPAGLGRLLTSRIFIGSLLTRHPFAFEALLRAGFECLYREWATRP